jgi:SAM-dependent methyltransferase
MHNDSIEQSNWNHSCQEDVKVNWENYKKAVSDSRDLVIIPTITENLLGVKGVGLDVGCGDGDLTEIIANSMMCTLFGIDINRQCIAKASERNPNIVFIVGDLSNRAISKTGVRFDFSYSNCFFNHLNNHSVIACIDDLYSSMKEGARVVILVPHWRRAQNNYKKVIKYPWGITAVPEYGNIQYFRYEEWYSKALISAGFTISKHLTIDVPESLKDSKRYGTDVGQPLFTLIVAEVKNSEETLDVAKRAFDIAHDNRKFEIEMLWKRSVFYWGFIAAAFAGYGASEKLNSNLSIIFGAFGFMCSVAWSAGNRGSKYWQEYWENKVVLFQNRITGDIFIDHFPLKPGFFSQFSARRLSVSKLIMGISDFTILTWLSILTYKALKYANVTNGPIPGIVYSIAIGITILYSIYLVLNCKSED